MSLMSHSLRKTTNILTVWNACTRQLPEESTKSPAASLHAFSALIWEATPVDSSSSST